MLVFPRPAPTIDPSTGEYDPREFVFPDPVPLGGIIFLGVIEGISTILIAFILYRVWRFRNHRLIQPRCVGTFIPHQFFTYLTGLGFALSLIFGKPGFCRAQDALNLVALIMGLHYNFNIPTLVYQSDLNAAKRNRGHSGEETKVVKNLRYFTLPLRLFYMAIFSVLMVGVFFVLTFFADLPGDCNRAAQLTSAIGIFSIIAILFYYLIKLGKVQDPYYMKFENNIGSVSNLANLFMMVTYPIVPEMYGSWYDFRWVIIFVAMNNLWVDGMFTALLTYDWFVLRLEKLKGNLIPEDQIKEADTLGSIFALSRGMDLFPAVLAHPYLLEAFTQFSVKEWSVENVLFYKGVEEFKELWKRDPKSGKEFSMMLVQEYVVSGAPLQVNLEDQTRKTIIREIEEGLCESTFDHSQGHVYDLMKKDTFEKWRKTADFKQAIQDAVDGRKTSSNHESSAKGSKENLEALSRGSQSQHDELRWMVEMASAGSGSEDDLKEKK